VGSDSPFAGQSNTITSTLQQVSLADCELQIGGTQPLDSRATTPEEAESLYKWTLGNTNTVISPLDPKTATLEQILDRSRLVMGDIVTYKFCATRMVRESSDQEFSVRSYEFVAFHSYDHIRSVTVHPEIDGGYFWESLSLGSRFLNRSSDQGWEESFEPPADGMQPTPPSAGLASALYEDEIELISTDEVSDSGEKVFRLAFTEIHEGSKNGEILQNVVITSVLISQETFRIVTYIREEYAHYEQRTRSNGGLVRLDWWLGDISTTHYYDHNLPIVLVAPDDYIPWQETVMAR